MTSRVVAHIGDPSIHEVKRVILLYIASPMSPEQAELMLPHLTGQ